jgi:hypothetical protein
MEMRTACVQRSFDKRVRVRVVTPRASYTTRSQTDRSLYRLRRVTDLTGDGEIVDRWLCDCPGFRYSGCCKHLGALERRATREGWQLSYPGIVSRSSTTVE